VARAAESQKRPPEILSETEVRALIGACSNRAPTGVRNRALIAVMWRCGLRISEALDLEPRDGKGDRARTVGLDGGTAALLARWLDRRRALGHNGRRRLFCTLDGRTVDQSYVRHLLRRLATKAGVERRVHPHALRHTYAAELAREGTPMNVLRDALGHSSLATTDRYLRDVAPVHVIETMKRREWSLD
jgi:site-specific recombinase XerD